MTPEIATEAISESAEVLEWEPPMPPTDLIFDDGEPLESNRHRIAMNVLIRSMLTALADRNDYFAGGNMFIYYSSNQARNRDFRGPDFFVVLNVDGRTDRQGWVVWEENGRYPDVIVELMSPSTAAVDTGVKREIYEQIFRMPDYFVYDPFAPNSLQGWHLDANQQYQPLVPNEHGWLWCQRLDLWLGTWAGTIDRETAVWARFYDRVGNLVLLPEEAAQQQAEIAQQQAERERDRAETAEQQLRTAQQDGLRQGALRQLLRLLTTRFGSISLEVEQRLQNLEVNQLEDLVGVALASETVDEFSKHLS
jgi:Uma2 family endonuclease